MAEQTSFYDEIEVTYTGPTASFSTNGITDYTIDESNGTVELTEADFSGAQLTKVKKRNGGTGTIVCTSGSEFDRNARAITLNVKNKGTLTITDNRLESGPKMEYVLNNVSMTVADGESKAGDSVTYNLTSSQIIRTAL